MANLIRRKEHGAMEPLRRFDPFEVMREMLEWEPFGELRSAMTGGAAFVPTFEVKETKDAYLFSADLPGVKESDLEISLTGSRLTVSGRRQEEKKEEDERYFAYERSYGSFSRSFTMPEGVDPEHVAAELKDGVLRLTLPKKPELKPKKIELKAIEPGKGEKAKA